VSARRDLRNAEREWLRTPKRVRRSKPVVSENRVLMYFGVSAVFVFVLSLLGCFR
jgi:hypothetical protein